MLIRILNKDCMYVAIVKGMSFDEIIQVKGLFQNRG